MNEPIGQSITANSSREWLGRRQLALYGYLQQNHDKRDWERVFDLMYYAYPDEGKKLLENVGMHPLEKIDKVIKWIVHSSQITSLMFGDQGMGKDVTYCRLFELIIKYCKSLNLLPPRIVTLGNIKAPPFVHSEDMFFNLKDCPFGTKKQSVYIYSSELEAEFPARNHQGEDNKMFSIMQNTFRHNHQKLFGCVKLSANVDISVLRTTNIKFFKYTSPEKLKIEYVERENILSELGCLFLPNDINDKPQTLMSFDNNLLNCRFKLPDFWNEEYSEQFCGDKIPKEKVYSFVRSKLEGKEASLSPSLLNTIQTLVYTRLRQKISVQEIKDIFSFATKTF